MKAVWALALLAVVLGAGSPGLARAKDDLEVAAGRALFQRVWTVAGAVSRASDGLGPLFNARACASCHPKAGGGELRDGGGLVLRFADDPAYGQQLQTRAVHGLAPEGRLHLSWRTEERRLDDGTLVELRAPVWRVEGATAGPPPVTGSLRLAPDLAGLGQVEAALADRGKPAFGLKGRHQGLAQPVEEALLLDMGLSTQERPQPFGDCTIRQEDCRQAAHGVDGLEGAELSPKIVEALLAFLRALPPPPRTGEPDPVGADLFARTGCAFCHRPQLGTLEPYSDFLAHDLGPKLADGDPADPAARQWRTTPLWGLGRKLADQRPLLHDGRGRTALEAIMWHGGAARDAVAQVAALPASEREILLNYLKGL